ncbi:carnitine O-acetyltransferase yat1 [Balamuthia mandrillaris]
MDSYKTKLFLRGGRNVQPYPHFELAEQVPRLPIPALEETAKRYLEYLAPLVSKEQLERTRGYVEDFIKPGGEGQALQEELKRLDKESPTSWLEGWWDAGYLEYRVPNFVHVNPFFLFKPSAVPVSQVELAARLTLASAHFYQKIVSGTLSPDKEKDKPLCMTQYGRFFASCRVPRPGRCAMYTFPRQRHIAVCSRGYFFVLDIFQDEELRVPVSVEALSSALEQVLSHTRALGTSNNCPEASIGALTADQRDSWAATRAKMVSSSTINQRSLELLDSALFVLVLDEEAPANLQEAAPVFLWGDVRARWFDKLQLIVCADGRMAGINMEHSPYDGHTALRYLSEVHKEVHQALSSAQPQQNQATPSTSNNHTATPTPKRLEWELCPGIVEGIQSALCTAKSLIDTTQLKVLDFTHYGKRRITKEWKFSPDAFVQMAYQLACFKLRGVAESTYESAMTKRFFHGRTETLRSVTSQSADFTRCFTSSSASDAEKVESLRRATKAHVQRMNEAKNGMGVDRHWLGLKSLAAHKLQRLPGYFMPEMFLDPSYGKLATSVLSTSNCGEPCLTLFGFGPVTQKGLGIGYMLHSEELIFCVSSFEGDAPKFAALLEESLLEMAALLERSTPKQPQQQKARL